MKRKTGLSIRVGAAALLGLLASDALAQTTITVPCNINDYEAQKRSDTGVFIASENFAVARVGHQSNFNNSGANPPGGISMVYFFQLPPLSPGDTISSAAFSVGIMPETSTGLQPTFNGDLYALGVTDTIAKIAAEAQNFWYTGDTPQTALANPLPGPAQPVQRLGDNFIVPADFISAGSSQAALPKVLNVSTYIQELYAGSPGNGFTPGTSYLVIRINADANTPPGGTQRYSLAFEGTATNGGAGSVGNRPMITLIVGGASGCIDLPAVRVSPAPTGATSVYVSDVSPDASQVNVYADGVLVNTPGSGAGSPPATPSVLTVSTSALVAGQILIARQVIGGIESCAPSPTKTIGSCTSVPVVSIPAVLREGDATVTVKGVDPLASEVNIYDGMTKVGTAAGNPPATASTVNVPVSGIVGGHTITAAQKINGVERCVPAPGAAIVLSAPNRTLLMDSFGDADRNNNGILDNPDETGGGLVDPVADIGAVWHKLTIGNHAVSVPRDVIAPGATTFLGDDNVYNIHVTNQDGVAVAKFPLVSLKQAGDGIVFSMRFKFNEWPAAGQRDSFRFGLHKHVGAVLEGDLASTTDVVDDPGYFATMNTGSTPLVRRLARALSASGGAGLFDLAETIESDSNPGINDKEAHELQFTIVRSSSSTMMLELRLDGQVIVNGEDTAGGGGGPYFDFDQVAFGGVAVSVNDTPYLDVSVDDVLIVSSVNPCNNPIFDTDGNNKVNAADFLMFQSCAMGPSVPFATTPGYCECMDRDEDGDLDMDDFGAFQRCFSGESDLDANCDD